MTARSGGLSGLAVSAVAAVSAWAARRWYRGKIDSIGERTRVRGTLLVRGRGEIALGRGPLIDGSETGVELIAQRGARLAIGDDVQIGGGTSIEAARSITIGDGVRIGRFCKILDNQLHPVRGKRHHTQPPSKPVVVEDGAVLEERVILLPGAHVQRNTTVLAGSVISRKVPRDVIVGGVTPHVIKRKVGSGP